VKAEARRRYRPDLWILIACLLSAAHFAAFPAARHPLATDVRYFLYFAMRTAGGATPHLDLFDNKTQLATFAGSALFRLAQVTGTEPLRVVRVGYVGFAALAAVAAFLVHRRLWGRAGAGLLALSVQAGFTLLGLLPCIGNVPKMLTALLATLACLLVDRQRWTLAGVAGALAFMDWQLGALAILAALVAALRSDPTRRAAVVARVILGAALGLAPFLAWYATRGALGAAFRQVVLASLYRGASTASRAGLLSDWPRRIDLVRSACPGEAWLVLIGVAGLALYALVLRGPGARAAGTDRLATALAVYHYGIVVFSLWELQGYGDVFILLHSLAFFAAVALNMLWLGAERVAGGGRRVVGVLVWLALALAVSRPWIARGSLRLVAAPAGEGVTLDDQRELAPQIAARAAGRRVAFVGPAEQLYLGGGTNPLPFVYWNAATYAYYRESPAESSEATLVRLLDTAGVDVVVCDRGRTPLGASSSFPFAFTGTVAMPSGYGVDLYERR